MGVFSIRAAWALVVLLMVIIIGSIIISSMPLGIKLIVGGVCVTVLLSFIMATWVPIRDL